MQAGKSKHNKDFKSDIRLYWTNCFLNACFLSLLSQLKDPFTPASWSPLRRIRSLSIRLANLFFWLSDPSYLNGISTFSSLYSSCNKHYLEILGRKFLDIWFTYIFKHSLIFFKHKCIIFEFENIFLIIKIAYLICLGRD